MSDAPRSDAADGYGGLERPLRPDAPFVHDWSLGLDLRPSRAIEPPEVVLAVLAQALDDPGRCGATVEAVWEPVGERGGRVAPPCRHVVTPGPYRALAVVNDAMVLVAGSPLPVVVNFDGCERCVTRLHVSSSEEAIRRAWWGANGRVEGDEELRPWRYRELLQPHLRRIVALLASEHPLDAELRWGDSRGLHERWSEGAWRDRSSA